VATERLKHARWVECPSLAVASLVFLNIVLCEEHAPSQLLDFYIDTIAEGANAGHIKYKYLMRQRQGWPGRSDVVLRLQADIAEEHRLLEQRILQGCIAYGLARNSQTAQQAAELYQRLIDPASWPQSAARYRLEIMRDLLTTPQIASAVKPNNPHLVSAFRSYLLSQPGESGALLPFALFARGNGKYRSAFVAVIMSQSKEYGSNYHFLKRASEFFGRTGDSSNALDFLRLAWDAVPDRDGEKKWVGSAMRRILVSRGRCQEAIRIQRDLLHALECREGEFLALAKLHKIAGDAAAVVQSVEQELAAAPKRKVLLDAATLLIDVGKADRALDVLTKLDLCAEPEGPYPELVTMFVRGRAMCETGNQAEGLELIRDAFKRSSQTRSTPWVWRHQQAAKRAVQRDGQ